MFKNLTNTQIAIIVIVVILLIWFIFYYVSKPKPSKPSGPEILPINPMPGPPQITPVPSRIRPPSEPKKTPFTLYNFFSPTCGYSKQFAPAWNEVCRKLQGMAPITVRAIDATKPENEDLAFYYNISGYPTIILVTPNRNVEYAGDRSVDDLHGFVMKFMREYYDKN